MKKSIILFLTLLLTITESNACLNYYYLIDSHGHFHLKDNIEVTFFTNFNLKRIEKQLKQVEKRLEKEHDYKLLSDYALLLLKAGKTKESIAILSQLSQHYPNEYQIASNLGTAYELNGEIEKALQYIKKGLELNPNSHEGSEWVHVKVLETKLKMEIDSTYLSKNSVLRLTEIQKRDTLIRNQIRIQLRERIPFSSMPNKIIASMLIDLGDCYANTASIEYAKTLYTIATLHYGANKDVVNKKIAEMIKLRHRYADIQPTNIKKRGEHIKLNHVHKLLRTKRFSDYKIDWDNVLIDTDRLLCFANLEKIDHTNKEPEFEKKTSDTQELNSIKEENIPKREDSNYLYYFLIGGLLIVVVVVLIINKK